MKQAIEEGFILDVLRNYTPGGTATTGSSPRPSKHDPEFDIKRATKKLRRYVESHDHGDPPARPDHGRPLPSTQVIALRKIGGEARAMVVTSGIARAIDYFHAIEAT